jgi:hypothetical protein
VDRALRQLWRVLRRIPEHAYDFYVLADHGQAHCSPYQALSGGERLERRIVDEFLGSGGAVADAGVALPPARRRGVRTGIRAYRRAERGLFQRFVNYLEADFPQTLDDREADERGPVRAIAAGPNAFLYVLDTAEPLDVDALDRRFPELAERLSRSAGIGFVLARSAAGPVCFWRGIRYRLGPAEAGPFASREDLSVVLQGIADLMAMPSAGDLVIYGTGAPEGHVSFIPETGGHAGPSPEELHTFIVSPPGVELPEPIEHPVQLYGHFIGYQCAPGPDIRREDRVVAARTAPEPRRDRHAP